MKRVRLFAGFLRLRPCPFLWSCLCLLCFTVLTASCNLSRVDPISPDIHGVSVKPVQGVTSGRYYYERHDPQTEKWYEARELVPGWGLMVYTRDGKRARQKELDKDIK